MKRATKICALLLCLCMGQIWMPARAFAAERYTVGTGGAYASVQQALDAAGDAAGDVELVLVSDVTEASAVSIPAGKGIASVTIKAAEGAQVQWRLPARDTLESDYIKNAVFCNGISLTVEAGVTIGSTATYSLSTYVGIFGGGNGVDAAGSPVITIGARQRETNSPTQVNVFGGGLNATLTGSPTIVIQSGAVVEAVTGGGFGHDGASLVRGDASVTVAAGAVAKGSVTGGGYAMSEGENAVSDLSGDVSVIIGGEVKKLTGGGRAIGNGTNLTASATVSGNVVLLAEAGSNVTGTESTSIIGGGYAGTSMNGATVSASVEGSCTTTIKGGFACNWLIGGGYAETSVGNRTGLTVASSVGGDVGLALDGAVYNKSTKLFLYGAGMASAASGSASYAVGGDVALSVARFEKSGANPCNLYAGGRIENGGSGAVGGNITVSLTDFSSEGAWVQGNATGAQSAGLALGAASVKTVHIGGAVEAALLWDFAEIVLAEQAALTLNGLNGSTLFSAGSMRLPESSSFITLQNAVLSGDLIGGGTIRLPSDKYLWIEGTATGDTAVETTTAAVPGGTLVFVTASEPESPGRFLYQNGGDYYLKKTLDGSYQRWTLQEAVGVSFTGLTADGSDTATTTELTLTFDRDVEGLSADDLSVTGAAGGTLTKADGQTGVYILEISGIAVADRETVAVEVRKTGYAFSPSRRTAAVRVYRAPVAPEITTGTLPGGTVGAPYYQTLTATGDAPISWSLAAGSLPAGLRLDAVTGAITGVPTAAGTSVFTVKAVNGAQPDAVKELSITIAPVVYQVVKGERGEWDPRKPDGLTFTADGEFSKLAGVFVNGAAIDQSQYSARPGSTIITLKASYLETLPAGTHTLRVDFADGFAETTFTIAAAENTPGPPATGDAATWGLWAVLAALAAGDLSVAALLRRRCRPGARRPRG